MPAIALSAAEIALPSPVVISLIAAAMLWPRDDEARQRAERVAAAAAVEAHLAAGDPVLARLTPAARRKLAALAQGAAASWSALYAAAGADLARGLAVGIATIDKIALAPPARSVAAIARAEASAIVLAAEFSAGFEVPVIADFDEALHRFRPARPLVGGLGRARARDRLRSAPGAAPLLDLAEAWRPPADALRALPMARLAIEPRGGA
jgi:hypothetical protein